MSQSIMRSGMTSPARAFMRSSNARSILKRPAALPLSPAALPFNASFSVMVSPSVKSPHVHFMNSPQLVATFATHSSEVYDRAPIKVSPNPVTIPERGSRYYSPTVDHFFKLAPPPKPKAAALVRLNSILKSSQQCASPAITDFEDPRSPKAAAAPVVQQIRFASFATKPRDLGHSLSSYPRSPYPSAPLSPAEPMSKSVEVEGRSRSNSDFTASSKRGRSVEPLMRAARLPVPPSPLQSSFNSPSLQRSHKPAPLALESQSTCSLSNAFWDSMTLESDTPMVTALEYPESADMMEDVDLKSPAPVVKSPGPSLMFAGQDGSVWSPSAPTKTTAARDALLRSALMSPGKAAFAKPKIQRSYIASPSPNDPFASFPSFAAVLSVEGSPLSYPPRAVLEGN